MKGEKQRYNKNVFINCPFDSAYKRLFDAIALSVYDCGFVARCALEEDDGSQIRVQKIYEIISRCRLGIHDLSRGSVDRATRLPRFNMQKTNVGSGDAFVAKLDSSGTQLLYSTYLGGGGIDGATCIAVDSAGDAYVTGFTGSSDFPTASPTQHAYGGGSFDAFVAVLSPSGTTLDYSTNLGGGGIDAGFGITLDSAGNVYVMGQTDSVNFPTSNPAQPAYGGGTSDVFIAKIKTGPLVTGAQVSGKRLLVSGIGFDVEATILMNGDSQKTANDAQSPTTALVARKAGKLINAGQTVTLQVRNGDGSVSNQFSFTRPTG